MTCAIWWIRRDLRLFDNRALSAALTNADQIIPVFILDPRLIDSRFVGQKRFGFLFEGLQALHFDLKRKGSRLVFLQGDPRLVLAQVRQEYGADQVFAEADHSPFARRRDEQVVKELPLKLLGSPAIHPPGSVLKPDGNPYTVFTPFSRAWRELPIRGTPSNNPPLVQISTPLDTPSQAIPQGLPRNSLSNFPAGEAEAQRRLEAFTRGISAPIEAYAEGRNQLDQEGTSRLSPYLRFGMLSPRQAALAALTAVHTAIDAETRRGAETWLNELIWRDFYIHILHHFPHVRQRNFRLEGVRWENDPVNFEAWCQGRTGYPVVDAAMRQLVQTGWMHNRARMIAASFLSKDLLIDWRWGEQWFMQHLVDGDPAANNGGWQWTAGTGTDAAPYFRIFNPTTQSIKHDPRGDFIRSYLPELAAVPTEYIHKPAKMPLALQQKTGFVPGKDYPYPIIEHAWARERALAVYSQAKNQD